MARLDFAASPWMRRRMSATSFSSGRTGAQALEPLFQLIDLVLELRQLASRRDAPVDIGAQRRQPRLTHGDVGLHLGHVEFPEPEDGEDADDDERADLRVPREFTERQIHDGCLLAYR